MQPPDAAALPPGRPVLRVIDLPEDEVLLRPGGSAVLHQVRELAELVDEHPALYPSTRPGGSGWIIPAETLPDLRAAAELRGWTVQEQQ